MWFKKQYGCYALSLISLFFLFSKVEEDSSVHTSKNETIIESLSQPDITKDTSLLSQKTPQSQSKEGNNTNNNTTDILSPTKLVNDDKPNEASEMKLRRSTRKTPSKYSSLNFENHTRKVIHIDSSLYATFLKL